LKKISIVKLGIGQIPEHFSKEIRERIIQEIEKDDVS